MNVPILIVEDDDDIANVARLYLERDGFTVVHAATGEEALERLHSTEFSLAILDVNLPGIDGFEVLQEIRRRYSWPVIVLTARREETDAVYGLGAGADEYVTKPFSPRVLAARVRAHLRRARIVGESGERTITCGALTLDTERQTVRLDDAQIDLAPREFALLRFLLERGGKPAFPEEIYAEVWGNEYGDVASVAVHIQRIRRKIERDPAHPRYVRTRRGYGYYIDCEEHR